MAYIFLDQRCHHIRSACGSLSKENHSDTDSLDHTTIYSSQKKIISCNIPHRLNGKPGREGYLANQSFFYKGKSFDPAPQKKQRDVQRNIGKPQRDPSIYNSVSPAFHQDRDTGKTTGYQPGCIKHGINGKCHQAGSYYDQKIIQIPVLFFHKTHKVLLSFFTAVSKNFCHEAFAIYSFHYKNFKSAIVSYDNCISFPY